MCTNETKQEILFLLALLRAEEPLSQVSLAQKMADIVERTSWSAFLVRSPSRLTEVLHNAKHYNHVSQTSPYSWKLEGAGRERLRYLIDRYAPEAEKRKLKWLSDEVSLVA